MVRMCIRMIMIYKSVFKSHCNIVIFFQLKYSYLLRIVVKEKLLMLL